MAESTTVTMGWDVGDKFTDVCVLGADGAILEQQQVRTTKHSLEKQLSRRPGARVVLEVGVHSRWISDLVRGHGHEVIVANARQVQLIYGVAGAVVNNPTDFLEMSGIQPFPVGSFLERWWPGRGSDSP